MNPLLRSLSTRFLRYSGAMAAVAAGYGVRVLCQHAVGGELPPYVTFYPAVTIVALFGGFWPGMLATALGAVVVDVWVLPATRHFTKFEPVDVVALVWFLLMGFMVSLLAERYRRAQKRLRDSAESQLEMFVAHAPAALAMLDREMRYLRVSHRWIADYHLEDTRLIGRSHYEVFPEVPERWKEIHRRALAGEVVRCDGEKFVRADGSVLWLRWTIHPWGEPGAEVGGILIFTEDITAQKRIEERLRNISRTYSVLTDVNQAIVRISDPIEVLNAACRIAIEKGGFPMAWVAMLDPQTGLISAVTTYGDTVRYLQNLGVEAGKTRFEHTPGAQVLETGGHAVTNDIAAKPIFSPWREQALAEGFRSAAVLAIKVKGQVRGAFILCSGEVGFFDEEEMQLLDEMAMDISYAIEVSERNDERARMDRELRSRTAFFEALMESARAGVMVKDDAGKVIYRNGRFRKMWGLPESFGGHEEEVLEAALQQIKDPARFEEKTAEIEAHPTEHSRDEIELKDGRVFTLSTAPVNDVAGASYGRLWIFDDATERIQMEKQLRQAQKMEAVGQLTGGIAHDFNNLLAIILGNLELLEEDVADQPALLKRVETVRKASERGADVTRHLLAFSRQVELYPTLTSPSESVRTILSFARTIGPDIEFQVRLQDDVPQVLVDASGLENALLNLIVNARDAMPRGGTITITTEKKTLEATHPLVQSGELKVGVVASLSVADTGLGMSSETLERVFEPFFSTKKAGKGTGLGLSMVYGFVKQSGGAVRLYSEEGHGTVVTLYLPVPEDHPDQHRATHEEERGPLLTPRKVLLVDDEPDLVEIALHYLQDMGYEACVATSPEAALRLATDDPTIDLLITDVIMPHGMNGVELAMRIRELLPQVRVIYSSGYPADAMENRGVPLPEGHFLRKPYQRSEFVAAVKAALREMPA